MVSILLLNPIVVTMNGENEIIREGFVYVENGKIVDVGSVNKLPYEYKYSDLVLNLKNKVVLPGFVSYHTHLSLFPLRFMGLGLTLREWEETVAWPYETTLTPEESFYASKLAIYTFIKNGVVAFADMHFNMDSVAKVAKESGVIANLSVAILETGSFSYEKTLRENIELYRKWDGVDNGRINVYLGPCCLRYLSREQLSEIALIAKEENIGIHVHASETLDDVRKVREIFNKRPVEVLKDYGLLSENTIIAHAVWVTEREIDYIAKSGANVAHCPVSNNILLSGNMPLIDMFSKNVKVGLGTDINPSWNVMSEARLAYHTINTLYGVPSRITPYTLLKMATGNYAKFKGIENHGKIAKGYDANIIVLDFAEVKGWPNIFNIYEAILFSEASVETVIVRGEVIMDSGEVLTINANEIRKAKKVIEEKLNKIYGK